MAMRTINFLHEALRDDIRDLITRRPLPSQTLEHLDPFLFLNHHGPQVYPKLNQGLPFGPHPHRGFETVTFILAGDLMHADSGGHQSVIDAGGVQWMTAGQGLVHAELSSEAFKREGGPLEILQLWLNLPARLKLTSPRYVGKQAPELPAHEADGGRVHVSLVSGSWEGHTGPFASLTDTHLMLIRLAAGGQLTLPAPADRSVLLYLVRGEVRLGDRPLRPYQLAELNPDGDEVAITATTDAIVLFGHAKPFGEPIVAYGPFVMNTRAEIVQAVKDYEAGLFGAVP